MDVRQEQKAIVKFLTAEEMQTRWNVPQISSGFQHDTVSRSQVYQLWFWAFRASRLSVYRDNVAAVAVAELSTRHNSSQGETCILTDRRV